MKGKKKDSYVMACKVTALNHEVRNNTVEGRILVAVSFGVIAKFGKVFGSLGNNIIEELKVNTFLLH
jgi:hypothetical protein